MMKAQCMHLIWSGAIFIWNWNDGINSVCPITSWLRYAMRYRIDRSGDDDLNRNALACQLLHSVSVRKWIL